MPQRFLLKHICPHCGSEWQTQSLTSPCENCAMSALFKRLPEATIAELDEAIFHKGTLMAIKLLREALDIGIHEALQLFNWRYEALRKQSPEKFQHTREEYGSGSYS